MKLNYYHRNKLEKNWFVFRKIWLALSKNVRGGLGHFLALEPGPSSQVFFILLVDFFLRQVGQYILSWFLSRPIPKECLLGLAKEEGSRFGHFGGFVLDFSMFIY